MVVDQMRAEYLQRYKEDFTEKGFILLMDSGHVYTNAHYNYVPTYTGPGHASISTGTTPKHHGVVANDWIDARNGYQMYCAEDTTVMPVGTVESASRRSPANLRALTFADGIKLHTVGAGKSFGVSVKDRGAIFPAGHFADGAYWMDSQMNFVTSSYYRDELPDYVTNFNKKEKALEALDKGWKLEYRAKRYEESLQDENPYEPKLNDGTSSFPYDLKAMAEKKGIGVLKNTPVANEMVTKLAMELIKHEDLGKDEHTDFLGISYSAPDYAGHTFGVRSREVQDMYLKLDKDLAELIQYLERKVGHRQYIIYLTADHGASENPNHLADGGFKVRNYNNADVVRMANRAIEEELGLHNAVLKIYNHHVYLTDNAKARAGEVALVLETLDPFLHVYTAGEIRAGNVGGNLGAKLHQGHQTRFSGDLVFALQPNAIFYGPYGSTHGSSYTYDTHVPFLIMGYGVEHAVDLDIIFITDLVDRVAEAARLPYAPNSTLQ